MKMLRKKLNAALDEVLSICQVNNFPVFISAAVANDKDRTEYKKPYIQQYSAFY